MLCRRTCLLWYHKEIWRVVLLILSTRLHQLRPIFIDGPMTWFHSIINSFFSIGYRWQIESCSELYIDIEKGIMLFAGVSCYAINTTTALRAKEEYKRETRAIWWMACLLRRLRGGRTRPSPSVSEKRAVSISNASSSFLHSFCCQWSSAHP